MLPRKNFDKNGVIWCNLGVPKYVITVTLKSTILRKKEINPKRNWHIILNIILDEHVSTK